MDSGYYEYLTNSAKNDPELNEHDKETVLAFLKRLDANPDKYAVAPRTIAYLNEESLEYADITTETLKKLDMSATQLWTNGGKTFGVALLLRTTALRD